MRGHGLALLIVTALLLVSQPFHSLRPQGRAERRDIPLSP